MLARKHQYTKECFQNPWLWEMGEASADTLLGDSVALADKGFGNVSAPAVGGLRTFKLRRAGDSVGLQLAGPAINGASTGLVAGPTRGAVIMAAVLKLGTKWINLDQVIEIQDNLTSLRVYYPVAHGAQNEIDFTEIIGSDASALRSFLNSIGTDVLADFGGAERAQGSPSE